MGLRNVFKSVISDEEVVRVFCIIKVVPDDAVVRQSLYFKIDALRDSVAAAFPQVVEISDQKIEFNMDLGAANREFFTVGTFRSDPKCKG